MSTQLSTQLSTQNYFNDFSAILLFKGDGPVTQSISIDFYTKK
jgi:hypothetical protein